MLGPSDEERRVLAAVDETRIVSDLVELVAIASVDGTAQELQAQRWCADRLSGLGLDVDCWEIDVAESARQPDFPGMEVRRDSALGCVGVLGGTQTPGLALYGHTDVVPSGAADLWPGGDPFRLRIADGVAWGRGACDMKAGVVAAMAAVQAVRTSGVPLNRPLAVHCVSGEEDGGIGAFETLRRGHRAEHCISGEPTTGHVIPASAGSLTFRLTVSGLSTHGSTRTRGVSAIEKFELVHRALRDLESERNQDVPALFAHLDLAWPLSIGSVRAGEWASTVPDRLVADGRYGVRIDETVAEAVTAFESCVAATCAEDPWLQHHPVTVSWSGGQFAPGSLPADHALLPAVRTAVEDVTGAHPQAVGGPWGSDLRHYAAVGIPTLQYGPGDVRYAHAIDEHVELAEIFACARVYALLALRLCR